MHDGEAEAAAGLEHPRRLADRAGRVVDVLQGHERDRRGRRTRRGREGRRRRRGASRSTGPPLVPPSTIEGEPSSATTECPSAFEVAREAAFAAADVEGQAARRRQQVEELVAVVLPVAVVTRRPEPGDRRRGALSSQADAQVLRLGRRPVARSGAAHGVFAPCVDPGAEQLSLGVGHVRHVPERHHVRVDGDGLDQRRLRLDLRRRCRSTIPSGADATQGRVRRVAGGAALLRRSAGPARR